MRQNVDVQARPEIIQNAYANLASRQIALVDLVAQTINNRDVAKYLSAQAAVASTADDLVQEAVTGLTLMNKQAVSSPSAAGAAGAAERVLPDTFSVAFGAGFSAVRSTTGVAPVAWRTVAPRSPRSATIVENIWVEVSDGCTARPVTKGCSAVLRARKAV